MIGPDDRPGVEDATTGPASAAGPGPDLGIVGLEGAELVGIGGFGSVYRVRQPSLNRVLAVKVLTAPLDGAAWDRFEREAYAMGTVAGHPNIVQVISTGVTANGRPYLLMPYIGSSLDSVGPLHWPTALRHGVKLSGALATAHAAGVLHRDLKPANVLISEFGEPLIADFGIARVNSGYRTATGVVTASVPFAPPEILEGRPPTVAADIYSLAATIHALISGSAPFAGRPTEELVATYLRISREPPPDLRPFGVPDAACRALESAMAKDPARRPESAAAFGELLRDAQRSAGQPVTTMPVASPVSPTPAPDAPSRPAPAAKAVASELDVAPTEPDTTQPAELVDTIAVDSTTADVTAHEAIAAGGIPTARTDAVTPGRRRRQLLVLVAIAALVMAGLLLRHDFSGSPRQVTQGNDGATDDVDKPVGLALTKNGDLLVCDGSRHRVVKVGGDGQVTVVAGDGISGDTGDGGPATQARLSFPSSVAVTDAGDIYVATAGIVRRIDSAGRIGKVTGLPDGFGVVRVAASGDGTLYIASKTTILVRSRAGTVRTLAADVGAIAGLAVHPKGGVALSDISRNQVLWVDARGRSTRIAGLASLVSDPREDGLPATRTALADPTGVAFDRAGRLYVSEAGNNRIRVVEPDGTIRTVAGNPDTYSAGDTGDGGPGRSATFQLLDGPLVVTADGTLYIGDVSNHRVRKLDSAGVHPVA